jgi:formate C-acetyltransferase
MLQCNKNILENPPETFLEVCQWLGWFYHASWMYNREGAGMQIDTFLYPYYRRDKDAGILDDEKATFILANLLLLNANYYQLAGPDIDGNDLCNDLSFLVLEAAHWLNSSANITIRIHDNLNQDLFRKGVEYLFKDGNGWPRFSGDKGLMNYTNVREMTHEMARRRIAVGCNWMALPGREYPLNDCVKINIAKVFDVSFHEIVNESLPTVEKLWDRFTEHLASAVNTTAQGVNFHLDNMNKHMPELLGNLMMHNTIEKGEDITLAAEFINIGVDGAGLGVVADSFAAIEQRIEKEKVLTWEIMKDAIEHDFEGKEYERVQLILKSSDRYCKGNSLGDKWAYKINETFSKMIVETEMPQNRTMIPGWFSWANTIALGKAVGATPDGRKRGAPITHGANPNYNFRKDGAATAMSNGIAMVQPGYGNPAPFQLELDPGLKAEDGGIEKVMTLLKGHVDQGGTLININIVDKQKILEAHEYPEKYPDLVVRVTGFTAYFVTLSPEFRQLVVDRMVETL